MRIYLATWLRDYTNGKSLTRKKAKNRLLSYHLYQEEVEKSGYPETALKEYVKTGKFESRKNKRNEN